GLVTDADTACAHVVPCGWLIVTTGILVLVCLYDRCLPQADALAAQRVHHQLLPRDTIFLDPYSPLKGKAAEELRAIGYTLTEQGWPMGDIQAVQVVDGRPLPASDPRGRGQGLVVEISRAPEAVEATPQAE